MPEANESADDVQSIYDLRFGQIEAGRNRVWQALVRYYFQQWVRPTDAILDVGAGYCEFINNIQAREKFALDLNPAARQRAAADVKVLSQDLRDPWPIPSGAMDVVFSSNFFEHLGSKRELAHCLSEAFRLLRPGGRVIVMGPNIRFCADVYWDFFDHHLPLSDRSMAEGLELAGFERELVIPRFMPYTMAGRQPPPPIFVRIYLAMPFAWRFVGKQFLIVCRKPGG
jgi:SAM-dependent methyltransferase